MVAEAKAFTTLPPILNKQLEEQLVNQVTYTMFLLLIKQ